MFLARAIRKQERACHLLSRWGFLSRTAVAASGVKELLSTTRCLGQADEAGGLLQWHGDASSPCTKVLQPSRTSSTGPLWAGSDLCWLCEAMVKGWGDAGWAGRVSCRWREQVWWALAAVRLCAVLLHCRWCGGCSVSWVQLSQRLPRWSLAAVRCFSGPLLIWQLLLFWWNFIVTNFSLPKKPKQPKTLLPTLPKFLDSFVGNLLKTVGSAPLGVLPLPWPRADA